MALNARKHTIPAGTDTTVSRSTFFETFANSIRDVVPVASITERSQLVTNLSTAGQAPSATKPLVVYRSDAPGLHRLEYTVNGTVWLPASGQLTFASKAAADSWVSSNGGYLSAGDIVMAGSVRYKWTGSVLVPDQTVAGVRVSDVTNSNGIILVPNPFGTIPAAWMQVTMQNNGNEGFGKILSAIVWDLPPLGSGAGVQVRIRRSDTNDWLPNTSVNLYATFGID